MRTLLAILLLATACAASALDHSHRAWDALLKKHVKYLQNGNASRVDYAGFMKDRAALKAVLDDYHDRAVAGALCLAIEAGAIVVDRDGRPDPLPRGGLLVAAPGVLDDVLGWWHEPAHTG